MRQIKINDEVYAIECWKNEQGILAPDQTTKDCRLWGYCVGFENNKVLCAPATKQQLQDDPYWEGYVPLAFPVLIEAGMKEGDSIVMHIDDANELFPIH